jgi:hypothetical protein
MYAHLFKIIVIKHHQLTMDKIKLGITAIIVKPTTLEVGDLGSNETTLHCTMLWLSYLLKY